LRARIATPGDPAEPVRPLEELTRGNPQRPAEEANPEELGERRAARDEGAATARRESDPRSGAYPEAVEGREDRGGGRQEGGEAPDESEQNEQQESREQQEQRELTRRDAEVRRHEAAHVAAGAGVVRGGATFRYQRGPDGRLYAVGGEVAIDTSKGRTPEETIRKAQRIRRAALSPADPSSQDRAVAAQASTMEARARLDLIMEQAEERGEPAVEGGEEEGDGEDPRAARAARAYASPLYTSPNVKITI